jgi:hypothetical protein
MTTTVSSRRSFLTSAAVAVPAAAIAPATTAPAAPAHPDAGLIELGRRFDQASAAVGGAVRRACEVEEAGSDAVDGIAMPEALRLRETDQELLQFDWGLHLYHSRGEPEFFTDIEVSDFREKARTRLFRITSRDTPEARYERRPWPEAQARADEIVKAWDERTEIQKRKRGELGITAAEDAIDRAYDALRVIENAIIAWPASTMVGLFVKLHVVEWCHRDGDDEGDIKFWDVENGKATDDKTVRSIIQDLRRLRKAAA